MKLITQTCRNYRSLVLMIKENRSGQNLNLVQLPAVVI